MANQDITQQLITAVNATPVAVDTISCTGAYVQFNGTYAGVTVNFEGTTDGGATWVPVGAYQINASGVVSPGTGIALASNSTAQWYLLVGVCQQVRVRASAWTSGTTVVTIQPVTDADPVALSGASATSFPPSTPAAAADGAANPTIGGSTEYALWFNGTTWDRVRNNISTIPLDLTGARTVSGTGVTGVNFNHAGAFVGINVTAVTGTTPTAVFKVQYSTDGGTNWADLDATNAATASITATGQYYIKVYPGIPTVAAGSCNSPLPRTWRLAWTLGGTTPSFTFVSNVAYIL